MVTLLRLVGEENRPTPTDSATQVTVVKLSDLSDSGSRESAGESAR